MSKLISIGWCTYSSRQNASSPCEEIINVNSSRLARITQVHRSHYEAESAIGKMVLQLTGKYLHLQLESNERPVVGDWCEFSEPYRNEQGGNSALITLCLGRVSHITRISPSGQPQTLVANVETAFIVCSANLEFNVNRIRRYLLLCREGNVQPFLVITKMDLAVDASRYLEMIQSHFPDLPIIATSAATGSGIEELIGQLRAEETYVFLGSSGVGKSTLVNALLGEQIQTTQDIRSDDDKGKHTTTSRQLFTTAAGALIIDTPGLREVQVLGGEEALNADHETIDSLQRYCRFSDCTHIDQPGCAIQAAIDAGEIKAAQFQNWQKLQREIAFAATKLDKRKAANSKRKWKQIHRNNRERKKILGR